MNGKQLRDQFDQQLEGQTSIAEVIKDLPLYDQILDRGQLMGKMMSRNLIEVVRRQAHELDRLGASEFREVEVHGQTIDQRDHAEEMANELAQGISEHFRVPIGEHSSMNCPWAEAGKILNGEYVTDTDEGRELKRVQARLRWVVLHAARLELDVNSKWSIRWDTSTDFSRRKFDTSEEAIDAAMAATESPA